MPYTDLVIAIGNHEHCMCAMDASAQILEQIKSCLIRPMHVFEHDQRLFALEFVQRCGEDLVAVRAGIDGRQQCAFGLPRDVVQRPEGPWRKERIACAPQYPRPALLLGEFLNQRGLADARLARHEDDTAAAPGNGLEPFREIRKTSFTLEQFHRLCTRKTPSSASCNPSVVVAQSCEFYDFPEPARCCLVNHFHIWVGLVSNMGRASIQYG